MNIKGLTIGFFAVDAVLIGIGAFLYLNQDRTAPVVTLPEKELVYTEEITEAELLDGVTAYDAVDGDVTASVLVEKISATADGRVIVTYAAVDSSNNVEEKSRIIKADINSRQLSEKLKEEQKDNE